MTTKEKITEEALTLFAEKGYKGTSVKNIADAVGIKDASLYNHFKSVSDFLKWPAFDLTDCLSIAHFSVRQRFNDTGADAPVQSNHFSR